ncbi:hypothetical protein KL906_004799 [Ogataea polymorpha]|nr:hypothetical protein KL906_004799 [Ogataea polymorpha]
MVATMDKSELEYQPKKIRAYAVRILKELTKKKTRPMLMCFRNWEMRVGLGGPYNEDESDDQTRVLVFNDKYISFLIPWMMSFCWYVDEIMEELADLRDLNTVCNGKLTLGPVFTVEELVKIDMIFRLFTTVVPKQYLESKSHHSKVTETNRVEGAKSTAALKPAIEAPKPVEITECVEAPECIENPEPTKVDKSAVSKSKCHAQPASFRILDASNSVNPAKPSMSSNPSAPPLPNDIPESPSFDYEPSNAVAQKPVQPAGNSVVIQKPLFDDLVNKIQGLQLSIEIMQNM